MKTLALSLCLVFCGTGCGARAVRQLTKSESDYLAKVTTRVDDHRASVQALVGDLKSLERQYAFEDRQKTTTAVAKARLLESMKAPWAAPSSSLQATQRAVILFHLYDLMGQEKNLFEADQDARDAERREVLDRYDAIARLLTAAIADEKVVLEYVNRPAGSQIAGIVNQTLVEARAASHELSSSSDPRLQTLAQNTEKAADRVEQTKKAIQETLNTLNSAKK